MQSIGHIHPHSDETTSLATAKLFESTGVCNILASAITYEKLSDSDVQTKRFDALIYGYGLSFSPRRITVSSKCNSLIKSIISFL